MVMPCLYDGGETVVHITRVELFHVEWERNKSAWIRIWTDSGLYGLGEASPILSKPAGSPDYLTWQL